MKREYYTDEVTLLDDGTYRWYYDMDMYQDRSMLYTLEKVNLFMFLGISVGGALLIFLMEGDASFARNIMLIGLLMGGLMALLYMIGFYIAAWIKRGNYRIRFAMREEGIKLVWGDRRAKGYGTDDKVLATENA